VIIAFHFPLYPGQFYRRTIMIRGEPHITTFHVTRESTFEEWKAFWTSQGDGKLVEKAEGIPPFFYEILTG
jgi:hypothetical protein